MTFHSLRERTDFQRLFQQGRKIRTPFFILIYSRGATQGIRFGCVIGKNVSKKAVVRNRLRRRSREFMRLREDEFKEPTDIILIYSNHAISISRKQLYQELYHAVSRIPWSQFSLRDR
jgi:ribonuclease P protein component